MDAAGPYLKLIGRVLLAAIFVQAGYSKITGYADTAGYMEQHGVPGVLLPLVILTELGGGLCVLTGLPHPLHSDRTRRFLRAHGMALSLSAG